MRVAIVGSGISGLSALWLLKQHSPHEVNIYEKDWRPGGQFQSVKLRPDGKDACWVDVGYLGHDPAAAPNFNLFLKILMISIHDSQFKLEDKRASTRDDAKASQLGTWNLAFEAFRFKLLAPTAPDVTLGQYLKREGYAAAFFDEYLLPRIAQKWRVPDDLTALSLPLSQVLDLRSPTHTIDGGAKAVVDTICSIVPPENLHLNTEIVSVESLPDGVALTEAGGTRHIYDHVILAVPGEVALDMLKRGGRVTSCEERLLTQMDHTPISVAVLQSKDAPGARRNGEACEVACLTAGTVEFSTASAPPSYNGSAQPRQQVSLNYDMTAIEHLDEDAGEVRVLVNGTDAGLYHYEYRVPLPKPRVADADANADADDAPAAGGDSGPRHISLLPDQGQAEANFVAAYTLATSEPFNANQPFPLHSSPPTPPGTALRTTRSAVRLASWVKRWIAYWVGFHVRGWNGVLGGAWRMFARVFGRSQV